MDGEISKSSKKWGLGYRKNIYKELWDKAPVAYHILDKKGIIKKVNETEAKMLGYQRQEMIGKPIFYFILPRQRQEAKKRFFLKISGQDMPRKEDRIYLKKDGSKIFVSINDVLEKNHAGQAVGIWTTMIDVTAQKELEKKLVEAYRHLGSINREISVLLDLEKISKKNKKGIIRYILNAITNISGAKAAILYRSEKRSNMRLFSALKIKGRNRIEINSISDSSSIIFARLIKEKYLVSGSCWQKGFNWLNENNKIKHFMLLPMIYKKIIKGTIFLGFSEKKTITTQEMEFYDLFSFHASFALVKGRILA